ncbi:predicted protein [Arabidopsis lyrata subsp. lyrata]|uniref:Predicted protein n=1 Tax=Arabidopsis lyrata subsp. lyrata TaxID=81972 RepID=D7M8E5_ARALL|nr:predicted protein [Arabidopsis lyrata subsp. lyrata]
MDVASSPIFVCPFHTIQILTIAFSGVFSTTISSSLLSSEEDSPHKDLLPSSEEDSSLSSFPSPFLSSFSSSSSLSSSSLSSSSLSSSSFYGSKTGLEVEDGCAIEDGCSVEDGCYSVDDGCCSVVGTSLFLFNPVFFGGIIGNEKPNVVTKEKRNSKI